MACSFSHLQLLHFLHLVSPTLPVGAYSYSEGLESAVEQGWVSHAQSLQSWLAFELEQGNLRTEAAIVWHCASALKTADWDRVLAWQDWLSAFRETEELRQQSLQMGRSLMRLLTETEVVPPDLSQRFPHGCHFAIAVAIAAQQWQLTGEQTVLGYLQSWLTNLVNAGVRLIPLGQTAGQQVLLDLYPTLSAVVTQVMTQDLEDLWGCNWGNSLASMYHETQYSRLFRS